MSRDNSIELARYYQSAEMPIEQINTWAGVARGEHFCEGKRHHSAARGNKPIYAPWLMKINAALLAHFLDRGNAMRVRQPILSQNSQSQISLIAE